MVMSGGDDHRYLVGELGDYPDPAGDKDTYNRWDSR